MHARRFACLFVLAIPAGVALADDAPPAPAAEAPAWPVTFVTEPVSNDPNPTDRLRALQDFEPLDLVEAAPPGVAAPAEAGSAMFSHRKPSLAIVRGEGDALAVFVDADGDGKFDEKSERYAPAAVPTTAGPRRTGTTWKVLAAKTAGADLFLHFTENLPRWAGALAAPANSGKGPQAAAALKVEFSDTAPAGAKEPADLPKPVRWGAGEYQAKNVVVAVGREADGTLRAALGDSADLSAAKVATAKAAELRQGKVRTGSRWVVEGLEGAGVRGNLTVIETLATLTGRMNAASTRRGSATVGGVQWVLMLVDGDYDGRFDSGKDLWWVGPANRFKSAFYANMFEGNEPFRALAGSAWEAYRLVSVDAAGAAVVAPEPAPAPLAEYLERRAARVNEGHWLPFFRTERDDFMAAQGIDAKRPRAATAPHLRYAASFEDAKSAAAGEGKPLLVDFEADWCIWCKRLDFYSYPDAEVAERLAKFTCVKISTDLDAGDTFGKLREKYGKSWGGLPTVGIFHADGVPVRFAYERPDRPKAPADLAVKAPAGPPEVDHIVGFLPPAQLVVALDAALAAWKAGARATPAPPPAPAAPPAPVPPPAPPAPAMGAEPAAGPSK